MWCDLQIAWHHRSSASDCDIPKAKDLKNKEAKVKALIAAVERHNGSLLPGGSGSGDIIMGEPNLVAEEEEEVDSDNDNDRDMDLN